MKLLVSPGLKRLDYYAVGGEVPRTAAGARSGELLVATVAEPILYYQTDPSGHRVIRPRRGLA